MDACQRFPPPFGGHRFLAALDAPARAGALRSRYVKGLYSFLGARRGCGLFFQDTPQHDRRYLQG